MLASGSIDARLSSSEDGGQHPSLRFVEQHMLNGVVNFARRATLQSNLIKETVIPSAGVTGAGLSMNVQSIALTRRAVDDTDFKRATIDGSDPKGNKVELTIASMVMGMVDGRASGTFVPITAPQSLMVKLDPSFSKFDPLMMYGRTINVKGERAYDVEYKMNAGKTEVEVGQSTTQDRVFLGRLLAATEDYGIWVMEHQAFRTIGKREEDGFDADSNPMGTKNVLVIPWVSETTPYRLISLKTIKDHSKWWVNAPISIKPTLSMGYFLGDDSVGDPNRDPGRHVTKMCLATHKGVMRKLLNDPPRNIDAISGFRSVLKKDIPTKTEMVRAYRLQDLVKDSAGDKAVTKSLEKYFANDVLGTFGYGSVTKPFTADDLVKSSTPAALLGNPIRLIRNKSASKGVKSLNLRRDSKHSTVYYESTIPIVGKTVSLYEGSAEALLIPGSGTRLDDIGMFKDNKNLNEEAAGFVLGVHPLVLTLPYTFRPDIDLSASRLRTPTTISADDRPACAQVKYVDLPNTKYRFSVSFNPELLGLTDVVNDKGLLDLDILDDDRDNGNVKSEYLISVTFDSVSELVQNTAFVKEMFVKKEDTWDDQDFSLKDMPFADGNLFDAKKNQTIWKENSTISEGEHTDFDPNGTEDVWTQRNFYGAAVFATVLESFLSHVVQTDASSTPIYPPEGQDSPFMHMNRPGKDLMDGHLMVVANTGIRGLSNPIYKLEYQQDRVEPQKSGFHVTLKDNTDAFQVEDLVTHLHVDMTSFLLNLKHGSGADQMENLETSLSYLRVFVEILSAVCALEYDVDILRNGGEPLDMSRDIHVEILERSPSEGETAFTPIGPADIEGMFGTTSMEGVALICHLVKETAVLLGQHYLKVPAGTGRTSDVANKVADILGMMEPATANHRGISPFLYRYIEAAGSFPILTTLDFMINADLRKNQYMNEYLPLADRAAVKANYLDRGTNTYAMIMGFYNTMYDVDITQQRLADRSPILPIPQLDSENKVLSSGIETLYRNKWESIGDIQTINGTPYLDILRKNDYTALIRSGSPSSLRIGRAFSSHRLNLNNLPKGYRDNVKDIASYSSEYAGAVSTGYASPVGLHRYFSPENVSSQKSKQAQNDLETLYDPGYAMSIIIRPDLCGFFAVPSTRTMDTSLGFGMWGLDTVESKGVVDGFMRASIAGEKRPLFFEKGRGPKSYSESDLKDAGTSVYGEIMSSIAGEFGTRIHLRKSQVKGWANTALLNSSEEDQDAFARDNKITLNMVPFFELNHAAYRNGTPFANGDNVNQDDASNLDFIERARRMDRPDVMKCTLRKHSAELYSLDVIAFWPMIQPLGRRRNDVDASPAKTGFFRYEEWDKSVDVTSAMRFAELLNNPMMEAPTVRLMVLPNYGGTEDEIKRKIDAVITTVRALRYTPADIKNKVGDTGGDLTSYLGMGLWNEKELVAANRTELAALGSHVFSFSCSKMQGTPVNSYGNMRRLYRPIVAKHHSFDLSDDEWSARDKVMGNRNDQIQAFFARKGGKRRGKDKPYTQAPSAFASKMFYLPVVLPFKEVLGVKYPKSVVDDPFDVLSTFMSAAAAHAFPQVVDASRNLLDSVTDPLHPKIVSAPTLPSTVPVIIPIPSPTPLGMFVQPIDSVYYVSMNDLYELGEKGELINVLMYNLDDVNRPVFDVTGDNHAQFETSFRSEMRKHWAQEGDAFYINRFLAPDWMTADHITDPNVSSIWYLDRYSDEYVNNAKTVDGRNIPENTGNPGARITLEDVNFLRPIVPGASLDAPKVTGESIHIVVFDSRKPIPHLGSTKNAVYAKVFDDAYEGFTKSSSMGAPPTKKELRDDLSQAVENVFDLREKYLSEFKKMSDALKDYMRNRDKEIQDSSSGLSKGIFPMNIELKGLPYDTASYAEFELENYPIEEEKKDPLYAFLLKKHRTIRFQRSLDELAQTWMNDALPKILKDNDLLDGGPVDTGFKKPLDMNNIRNNTVTWLIQEAIRSSNALNAEKTRANAAVDVPNVDTDVGDVGFVKTESTMAHHFTAYLQRMIRAYNTSAIDTVRSDDLVGDLKRAMNNLASAEDTEQWKTLLFPNLGEGIDPTAQGIPTGDLADIGTWGSDMPDGMRIKDDRASYSFQHTVRSMGLVYLAFLRINHHHRNSLEILLVKGGGATKTMAEINATPADASAYRISSAMMGISQIAAITMENIIRNALVDFTRKAFSIPYEIQQQAFFHYFARRFVINFDDIRDEYEFQNDIPVAYGVASVSGAPSDPWDVTDPSITAIIDDFDAVGKFPTSVGGNFPMFAVVNDPLVVVSNGYMTGAGDLKEYITYVYDLLGNLLGKHSDLSDARVEELYKESLRNFRQWVNEDTKDKMEMALDFLRDRKASAMTKSYIDMDADGVYNFERDALGISAANSVLDHYVGDGNRGTPYYAIKYAMDMVHLTHVADVYKARADTLDNYISKTLIESSNDLETTWKYTIRNGIWFDVLQDPLRVRKNPLYDEITMKLPAVSAPLLKAATEFADYMNTPSALKTQSSDNSVQGYYASDARGLMSLSYTSGMGVGVRALIAFFAGLNRTLPDTPVGGAKPATITLRNDYSETAIELRDARILDYFGSADAAPKTVTKKTDAELTYDTNLRDANATYPVVLDTKLRAWVANHNIVALAGVPIDPAEFMTKYLLNAKNAAGETLGYKHPITEDPILRLYTGRLGFIGISATVLPFGAIPGGLALGIGLGAIGPGALVRLGRVFHDTISGTTSSMGVLYSEEHIRTQIAMLPQGDFSSWGPTTYFSATLTFSSASSLRGSTIRLDGARAMKIPAYPFGKRGLSMFVLPVPLATFAVVFSSSGKGLKWSPSFPGISGSLLHNPYMEETDNVPMSGVLSATIKTVGVANPMNLTIPYNFLGNGTTSGKTPGNVVYSSPLSAGGGKGRILPGTTISTVAATYSNMGDPYLGEQYPLAEVHMCGTLTSRYTIQLKTLAFAFLSNMDIVQKHLV